SKQPHPSSPRRHCPVWVRTRPPRTAEEGSCRRCPACSRRRCSPARAPSHSRDHLIDLEGQARQAERIQLAVLDGGSQQVPQIGGVLFDTLHGHTDNTCLVSLAGELDLVGRLAGGLKVNESDRLGGGSHQVGLLSLRWWWARRCARLPRQSASPHFVIRASLIAWASLSFSSSASLRLSLASRLALASVTASLPSVFQTSPRRAR